MEHRRSAAPGAAANPSPSTLTLVQVFGGFIVALTVPLVMAVPDGSHTAVVRKVTYYTLGVAELVLIPLLLVKSREGVSSGFAPEKLAVSAGVLMPFLLFRGYALFANPKLMQPENEGKAKEK